MQVHWLCLGVLLISSVTAEMHDEEIQDADVEVEDFDKNSQETDLDKGSSSLEVMYKTPKPTGEVYFTETFDDGVLTGVDHDKAMKVQERTIHLTLKVQSS